MMCLRIVGIGLVQFIKIFAIYLFPELRCLLHSCLSDVPQNSENKGLCNNYQEGGGGVLKNKSYLAKT